MVRAKLHELPGWRRFNERARRGRDGLVTEKDPKDDGSQQANLAMVGLQVAVGVGVGYAVGWWLDRRYGWGNKGVTIGSLLGLAGGLYLLIKDAIRINKD